MKKLLLLIPLLSILFLPSDSLSRTGTGMGMGMNMGPGTTGAPVPSGTAWGWHSADTMAWNSTDIIVTN